ncbi:MAG: hypothetical protein HYS77_12685 [Candidatus Rokubacteria bacterium]|nr:hypothetical protein [Candidatus Rokubacteria bacterium]
MTWQVMGLRQKVQRELMASALPEDLQAEFHRLSEWAHTVPGKFDGHVHLRLIDAASIEGFCKSLVRRFRRYPAFAVEGQRYVGTDFSQVETLIARALRRKEDKAQVPPTPSTAN